jgi:hypothetical protein
MAEDPKKKALETASIIEDALQSIAAKVSDIFEQAMAGTDKVTETVTKDIQKRFNQMAKVTDDIASNAVRLQEGLLKSKSVEEQILKRKIQQEALGTQLITHFKNQGKEVNNIEDLIKKQNEGSLKLTKSQQELVNEYIKSKQYNDDYIKQLDEQLKAQEKIEKTVGSTGKLLKGVNKIPIIGQFLDAEDAIKAANKAAAEGAGKMGAMGAAAGSLGKSLVSGLTDPLFLIGLLIKGFQMFLEIGFAADKQITDLSKSMAVSHEEATATRDRFIEIQNSGESIFNTTKNLVAAQMELADALGATRGFTEQQVKDQVMLTKQMGFTAEEAEGIQKLAMANGMTAEGVTNSVIKQTSALAKQTGIQLDNKAIIGEVAKVSGQLRLQYANNPKLIAKAVVETKKLGINMEIAANAAKGLLDFESSIENELSAELLTGKALNLERARGLALNGDSVGAAKEMLAQVGSASEFANMNVIQQEAIAKAVGMSTDDLANSLVTQENLKKLGSETRSQVEEQIEAAKALGDTDKVRMLEASIGNEKEAQIALKKISAQDKLNAAVDTMKSMLASILEGPAAGLIDWIGKLAGDAKRLKSVFETVKSTMKGMAQLALAKLAINVYASLANIPVVGPALGLVAGIAAYAWGQSLIPSFEEGGIVQGSSYKGDNVKANVNSGEMILNGSQQKNLFDIANNKDSKGNNNQDSKGNSNQDLSALTQAINGLRINKKDNIITGTNPGGRDNINQDSSALIQAINGLRSDMKALASRPIQTSVQIDGKEVVLAQGTYSKEKGDANRMESWQMS